MKQLLIPTDFSDNSWNAIRYALSFFKNERVCFHLLHIEFSPVHFEDPNLHVAGMTLLKQAALTTDEKFKEFFKRIENFMLPKQHTFKKVVKNGLFIERIREYVAINHIDLIVLGTKGASGLKEITIGSLTGEIITKVKCNTLVIPENAVFKVPLRIAFPTDFNLIYKSKIIESIQKMVATYNSSLMILRVAQTDEPLTDFQKRNRTYLNESCQDLSHSFHVVENTNLEDGLQNFVTTMHIDMIAMIAKNLNFFQRILFKPKVARISYHTEIPFLVLHE